LKVEIPELFSVGAWYKLATSARMTSNELIGNALESGYGKGFMAK